MSGISIGELVGTLALNDQFSGPINKAAKEVGLFSTSFGAISGAVGGAVAIIGAGTAAITLLGQRGAAVNDVREAFEGLTARAGESADVMLGALREGTLGTIGDFDLMKMANSALGTGLVSTTADMRTLAEGARLLADRTGGDTAEAFDTLTTAMEKGKAGGLKSLGVFVDMKGAIDEHAKALGKNASDLTQHERATAVNQATLEALRREIMAGGPATADFGDQIARGAVMVENFTDSLGSAIASSPVIAAAMTSIYEGIQNAFGDSQKSLVESLMVGVNEFAIGLTYVAQTGVVVAQGLTQGFYVVKTAILGILTASMGVITGLTEIADGVVQMAASVPGASALIGDLGSATAALKADANALTDSLREQTKEAFEGAMGHSALGEKLNSVNGFIVGLRDNMEAAKNSTATMNVAADETKNKFDNIGNSAKDAAKYTVDFFEVAAQAAIDENEAAKEVGQQKIDLANQIALANTAGLDQKLLQIEQERQAEIAALEEKKILYPETYQGVADLVNEKYRLMAAAARGYHTDILVQAQNMGFQTRAQQEQTAQNAQDTYERMKESGKFTYSELQKAHKAWKDAEASLNQTHTLSTMQQFELIANAAKTLIRAIFGNSKAGAIATAIIDTAQAVVKALASAPPPLNYGLAAAVGAAGLVQINKIRSTEASLAMGTVGTRFEDWGRESIVALHGQEAVVNKTQGASLAGMVEEALQTQDQRIGEAIQGLREDMDARDRRLPLLLRDAALRMV